MKIKGIEEVLSGKGEIKELPFTWLPNGKDFIIDPNNKEEVNALLEKYCVFDTNGEILKSVITRDCHMTKEDYVNTITRDYRAIHAMLNSMTAFSKDKEAPITVRHCYTPNGHGYYALTKGELRRFVVSELNLQKEGGCWSYRVWLRMYLFNAILTTYLKHLRQKLAEKHKNFSMEVVPLYMGYIAMGFVDVYGKDISEDLDEKLFEKDEDGHLKTVNLEVLDGNEEGIFWGERFLHYKELIQAQKNFCILYRDYFKKVDENGSNLATYNGDFKNKLFYFTESTLDSAINSIYAKEEELKAVGLWTDARNQIDLMNDYIHRRWYKADE